MRLARAEIWKTQLASQGGRGAESSADRALSIRTEPGTDLADT